jgi:two-component system OmpR family sensor kinase
MSEQTTFKIMLIEDSEVDAFVIKKYFSKIPELPVKIFHAGNMDEAYNLVYEGLDKIDLILLDLGLPDTDSPEDALKRALSLPLDAPIVALTNLEDHEYAIHLIREGAVDFVRKSALIDDKSRLHEAISFSICRYKQLADLKRNLKEKDQVVAWVSGSYSMQYD